MAAALSRLREDRPSVYSQNKDYRASDLCTYTERRSVPENCIIDNTHCIVLSFKKKHEKNVTMMRSTESTNCL